MKILVVDDDIFFLKVTEDLLDEAGHEVITARSGATALSLAQETQPDLVVLDIVMPDMLGTEISRQLRSGPTTAGVPILLTSAGVAEFDGSAGDPGEYQADDFILKPFKPENLLARVDRLAEIGTSRARGEAPPTPEPDRRDAPRVPVDVEVSAKTAKALLFHPALNLSTGGLCIVTSKPAKMGTPVELRFRLPPGGEMIRAEGQIAWCREKVPAKRWLSGISFTEIAPEDLERIQGFTQRLLKVVRAEG